MVGTWGGVVKGLKCQRKDLRTNLMGERAVTEVTTFAFHLYCFLLYHLTPTPATQRRRGCCRWYRGG